MKVRINILLSSYFQKVFQDVGRLFQLTQIFMINFKY